MSAQVINLSEARLARGIAVPVLPSEVFAPPPGKRVGDRVFIKSVGVFGIVMTVTPRKSSGRYHEWTLQIDIATATCSCSDSGVDPAPESGRD